MAMTVEPSVLEADLAAGRLCCPVCDGSLSRWGFARERTVRLLQETRSLRPRRAYCRRCAQTTHVLLPAWAVARRRDGVEVIGWALLAKANGQGHRRIAATLQRSTRWVALLERAGCGSGSRHRRGSSPSR